MAEQGTVLRGGEQVLSIAGFGSAKGRGHSGRAYKLGKDTKLAESCKVRGRERIRLLVAELLVLKPRQKGVWMMRRWSGDCTLKRWTSWKAGDPREVAARPKGCAGCLEEKQRPGGWCAN